MTRSQSGVVGAPEVVDDLHHLAGVDAGEVGQELEAELGLVVERAQDLDDVAGADPDLGLVVALADRPVRRSPKRASSRRLEGSIHRSDLLRDGRARSPGPANGRGGP